MNLAARGRGMTPILEVQNLHVSYFACTDEMRPALAGVSFALGAGEVLGILGESGSGKSTLASALLRLLPPNGKIQQGKVLFEGDDLLSATPQKLQNIRGKRIGLILQEPSSSLHPTIRVGQQVSNILAAHDSLDRQTLRGRTSELLATVFPADSERISHSYPHELSGGQRQRIIIAQAIACNPSLVVADEPTASLDPATQQEILTLFRDLRQKLALSVILITHNPALLAGYADRVLVLYAGRVAEIGPTANVLSSPRHPYTAALLRCLPSHISGSEMQRKAKLHTIAGDLPDLSLHATGCQFEPRCEVRMTVCKSDDPTAFAVSEGHNVSCFKFAG